MSTRRQSRPMGSVILSLPHQIQPAALLRYSPHGSFAPQDHAAQQASAFQTIANDHSQGWLSETPPMQEQLPSTVDGLPFLALFDLSQGAAHLSSGFHGPTVDGISQPWCLKEVAETDHALWLNATSGRCIPQDYIPLGASCNSWCSESNHPTYPVMSAESPESSLGTSSYASSQPSPLISFDPLFDGSTTVNSVQDFTEIPQGHRLGSRSHKGHCRGAYAASPELALRPQKGKTAAKQPAWKMVKPARSETQRCTQRGLIFDERRNSKANRLTQKTGRVPVYCAEEGCNRPFGRQADLTRHIKSAHTKENYPCPNCPKSFSRTDTRARHVKGACRTEDVFDLTLNHSVATTTHQETQNPGEDKMAQTFWRWQPGR